MIVDYEGAPVFGCLYNGEYYTVKNEKDGIVTIEKQSTIVGIEPNIVTQLVEYEILKKENEHFMMRLI